MPSWGPFLPLDDAPDPESGMEHGGQGFITKELMIGMTTTESYNDFNAADIQVIIKMLFFAPLLMLKYIHSSIYGPFET